MKKRTTERDFLTAVKRSLLEKGAFYFKIPDMPHFPGAKFRFDIPKPFDAVGVYVTPFVIEAKVLSGFKDFKFSDLRPSQQTGLTEWCSHMGGTGYLFLFISQKGNPKTARSPIYRLIVVSWADFMASGGIISKAEMVATKAAFPRLRRKKNKGSEYYFNLDAFLLRHVGLID